MAVISLYSSKQLLFLVMNTHYVFFYVGIEYLRIIRTNFVLQRGKGCSNFHMEFLPPFSLSVLP